VFGLLSQQLFASAFSGLKLFGLKLLVSLLPKIGAHFDVSLGLKGNDTIKQIAWAGNSGV